ncbi:MAG: chemotaxis protein CheW [Actinomycetota bacterium]|nr:chemotaxis protein CheW [Actinomycetota bacterium]
MNATATSTPTAAGTTGGRQQLVVFPLAGEHYALPIGTVSEIIRSTRLRSIVSASGWVEGIIAVRGKVILIYDLATRLGLSLDGEATKVVIVEATTEQLGIPADDVDEVLTITADQLEDVPARGSEAVKSIAKVGDRLVMLLDPTGLFSKHATEV